MPQQRGGTPYPPTTGTPAGRTGGAGRGPAHGTPRGPAGRAGRRPRYRGPVWARLLVYLGALLIVVSGGTLVSVKLALNQVDKGLNKDNLLQPGQPAKKVNIKGPVNVLLVGIDPRDGLAPRSDSIIVLHVPASHDQAYLVSIPRDSKVDLPPWSMSKFEGLRTQKINAAFSYGAQNGAGLPGGFGLLRTTVGQVSGIPFHAGAIVNFDGFRALVTALGGVELCIDQTVTSIHIGTDRKGKYARPYNIVGDTPYKVSGVTPVVYKPGCRRMAPWEALDYVRQRDIITNPDGSNGQGDYDRQRHQQQFIKAVFVQALKQGLTNPLKAKSIIDAAGKAFTVDLNGLSLETWLSNMSGIRDITMIKSNAGRYNPQTINGQSFEILSPDTMNLLQSIRTDTVDTFLQAHPDWISKV